MKLLESIGLGYAYDYTLFEDINLDIKARESVAILGVSGCGKSTLLHILSSLLSPKSGKVIYNEKSMYSLTQSELLKIRRNDFGIIFQSHYLFKGFSTIENIELASVLSDKEIDFEILKQLKIDKLLSQKVTELSGGQQQRVSIARVLCKKPRIIFADEPTGNLDTQTAKEVMKVIFEYIERNNAALFLVTHDNSLASSCSRAFRLENKQLNVCN